MVARNEKEGRKLCGPPFDAYKKCFPSIVQTEVVSVLGHGDMGGLQASRYSLLQVEAEGDFDRSGSCAYYIH
jgi:hypothetical protein